MEHISAASPTAGHRGLTPTLGGWWWGRGGDGGYEVGVVGVRVGQDASIMFAYYAAGSHCHFLPPLQKEKQAGTQTKQKAGNDGTEGGETGSPGALVWMDAERLCFLGTMKRGCGQKVSSICPTCLIEKSSSFCVSVSSFLTRYLGFAQFYEQKTADRLKPRLGPHVLQSGKKTEGVVAE